MKADTVNTLEFRYTAYIKQDQSRLMGWLKSVKQGHFKV